MANRASERTASTYDREVTTMRDWPAPSPTTIRFVVICRAFSTSRLPIVMLPAIGCRSCGNWGIRSGDD